MLAQQCLGWWAIHNGMGNSEMDMTIPELLVQAKVCGSIHTTCLPAFMGCLWLIIMQGTCCSIHDLDH